MHSVGEPHGSMYDNELIENRAGLLFEYTYYRVILGQFPRFTFCNAEIQVCL